MLLAEENLKDSIKYLKNLVQQTHLIRKPLRRPTERAGIRREGMIVDGAVAARPGHPGREDVVKNMLNEPERTSCSQN